MTAIEFFDICLGLLGDTQSNSGTTKDYFLKMLNQCLSECFEIEQGERSMQGLEALEEPQYVNSYTEKLVYTNNTLLNVVALGCATMMAAADDETGKASFFLSKYDAAKNKPRKAVYVDVEDYYGGGEW